MRDGFELEIAYNSSLETDKFARIFNDKSQSYKFYWLEAILDLLPVEKEFTFNDLIEDMICNAWTTVTYFKLRLGPTVNGNAENFLEHAVKTLYECMGKPQQNIVKDEIRAAIKEYEEFIHHDKVRLADYVPYKLLYPFFTDDDMKEGLEYIKNDQHRRLIAYMEKLTGKSILYRIYDGKGLDKKIALDPHWENFIRDNYVVIKEWIQYNKAQFLEDRNPGVPGIIYKIDADSEGQRKLEKVRDLWKTISDVTGKPIWDIYLNDDIETSMLSIDHFVPRSYIANDEIWNLIPMQRNKNSAKNNKLPEWDVFFKPFADYQFYLYDVVFPVKEENRISVIVDRFEKCRRYNLNAVWASEKLYKAGNTELTFKNILEHNLKPIYEAAKLQGFETWIIGNA